MKRIPCIFCGEYRKKFGDFCSRKCQRFFAEKRKREGVESAVKGVGNGKS